MKSNAESSDPNQNLTQKPMSMVTKIENQKKSILKTSGSTIKPKSKVSWGNLSVKIQLPSPDEEQLKNMEETEKKAARAKFYKVAIDEREEFKNTGFIQNNGKEQNSKSIGKRPQISLTQFLEQNPAFQVTKLSPQKVQDTKPNELAKFLIPVPAKASPPKEVINPAQPQQNFGLDLKICGKPESKTSSDITPEKNNSSSSEKHNSEKNTPEFNTQNNKELPRNTEKLELGTPKGKSQILENQTKVRFEENLLVSPQQVFTPNNNGSNRNSQSILRSKVNPQENVEKEKIKVIQSQNDEILMTPLAKSSRFKFVKSPADMLKIPNSIPAEEPQISNSIIAIDKLMKGAMEKNEKNIRKYLELRFENLKNVTEKLMKVKADILSKKSKLDFLILGNDQNKENATIGILENELIKTKEIVKQNSNYIETVNYFKFSAKKFGWKIFTKGPFIHFPYLNFTIEPHNTICKILLSKLDIISSDLSNIGSIISRDNMYFL